MFPAEHEKNAADDHRSDSCIRLPVNAVLLFFRYFDYAQIYNLLFGDICETCVDCHQQTDDEDDEAGCFHCFDPLLDVAPGV